MGLGFQGIKTHGLDLLMASNTHVTYACEDSKIPPR